MPRPLPCRCVPQTKQQIKRLRRQQSNRESARRSRQRKAEEANMLARRVGEMEATCSALQAKTTGLEAEVQQLRSIIDMMAGDSSALAAQVRWLACCWGGRSQQAASAVECMWWEQSHSESLIVVQRSAGYACNLTCLSTCSVPPCVC